MNASESQRPCENCDDFVHDGIRSLDNPVPNWWGVAFAICLMISPVYLAYYHGGGRTATDMYDLALAENTRKQFAMIGELKPDEGTLARFMQKDNWLRVGKVVFKANCVSCHGRNAEGKVGPNLTDDKFKHIKNLEDVANVILKGANNNAMPPWDGKLHPNEIVLVSAYVASLRGTNAQGGKAGEGSKIDPWPDAPPEPEPTETPAEG